MWFNVNLILNILKRFAFIPPRLFVSHVSAAQSKNHAISGDTWNSFLPFKLHLLANSNNSQFTICFSNLNPTNPQRLDKVALSNYYSWWCFWTLLLIKFIVSLFIQGSREPKIFYSYHYLEAVSMFTKYSIRILISWQKPLLQIEYQV